MQEITIYDINGNSLISLAQWDKNVKIRVKETEIDKAYNVHFFNKNNNEAMVVKSSYQDGILSAMIPNDILTEPFPILGYVFVDKNDEQKSTYYFRITIKKRPKPSDYIYSDQKEFLTFEKVLEEAKSYANNADEYAQAAKTSEDNSKSSEAIAELKASETKTYAEQASKDAINAHASKMNALESANISESYALQAKSFLKGTNGEIRPNDNSDCAEFYYNQIKQISQSINGIIPMGTITFDELSLPENQTKGFMFDISDSFVSDVRFKDGGGISYGAGNNVIYTAEGKWDVLASSDVSGVKGNKETFYRQGFVNITPENIGAVSENGDISTNTVIFELPENQENFESGEKLSIILGKIKKIFNSIKKIAFTANYNDLNGIPIKVSEFENDSGYKNSWRGIQDNLESDSAVDSLSANQGKILDNKITELNRKSYADGYIFVELGAVPNKNVKNIDVIGIPSDAKHAWIDTAWAKKSTSGLIIPLPYVDTTSTTDCIRIVLYTGRIQISTAGDWSYYNAWAVVAYKL